MSKFFIQLLLSVFIGVSAAVGFRSDLSAGFKETFKDVKVIAHETADAVVGMVGEAVGHINASVSVSTDVNAKPSNKENAKVDVRAKNNSDVQVSSGSIILNNLLSGLSVNSSSTANSQTNLQAGTGNTDLTVKDKTKSTLDLSLDPIK